MDTTTAARQAGVTIATVRLWCRYGAVAAVKVGRRWAIDAASLTHRIALGIRRARKATAMTTTGHLSSKTRTPGVELVVTGPTAELAAAFETDTPVTVTNAPYAGETVHLGLRRQAWGDDGIILKTIGLDRPTWIHEGVEIAAYAVDTKRLDEGAPTLAQAYRRVTGERLRAAKERELRADAEERAFLNRDNY